VLNPLAQMAQLPLRCAQCGGELASEMSVSVDGTYIDVVPCQKCLDKKLDEGLKDGYAKGLKDGTPMA